MSQRTKDTTLATQFVHAQHNKAEGMLDSRNNKLSSPLNVMVTGASKGIGAGIACAYAQAGAANLILVARSSSSQHLVAVERRTKGLNPSTTTRCLGVDITNSNNVAELAKRVKTSWSTGRCRFQLWLIRPRSPQSGRRRPTRFPRRFRRQRPGHISRRTPLHSLVERKRRCKDAHCRRIFRRLDHQRTHCEHRILHLQVCASSANRVPIEAVYGRRHTRSGGTTWCCQH